MTTAVDTEYHIASFVAHAMLEQLVLVQEHILLTPGAEIHATSEMGKIVFTLEAEHHKDIANRLDLIREHRGLLNIAPVYHEFLTE
ncbi:chaperone NapD [Thalassotalea agarivorans]|uniref:Chaperone NapD n=1 Tax=Thalassotalea agarivorans TaxID=349064 RepID=A0A1H9ZCB5_THASX|nr:chaperone NapD [Thalassotalea agarivorans]SES79260.1 periplasmic nitrate reductase chaperone NapD [Thalassotalea agarivorans]